MPGTMPGVSYKLASIKSIDSTPETYSALTQGQFLTQHKQVSRGSALNKHLTQNEQVRGRICPL